MKLPINVRWDLSVKVHLTITHMAITDKDISNEVVKPHPVELVDYDLVVPYPLSRYLMDRVDELVGTYPEGIKLYDSIGRIVLNLETGELYPKEEKEDNEQM
jgi:hypothetical protein